MTVNMTRLKLSRGLLFRIFFRSFLLQASWNFERMQNLGVLYVLAPALRRFYAGEALKESYSRHMEYFNTHPFMASAVVGSTIAMEEQKSSGASDIIDVQEFKGMVMAPYAAMGDAFFWGGLRPLAACVALYLALCGSLWAPLVFLVLFNLPHVFFRLGGLFRGVSLGVNLTGLIQHYRLPDLAVRCKEATTVLLGGLSALIVYQCLKQEDLFIGYGGLALPVIALIGGLSRKGVSTLVLTLTTATICVLVVKG